jgi:hypothetical protein
MEHHMPAVRGIINQTRLEEEVMEIIGPNSRVFLLKFRFFYF